MWEFGIFDQAQVQDRESSHYGLWQISIESSEKLLYNSAKQNQHQHKYMEGFLLKHRMLNLTVSSYIYVHLRSIRIFVQPQNSDQILSAFFKMYFPC